MPIIKSAKKAARQAVKRTANNAQIKKSIRLALKDFKKKPTAKSASKVQSEYDKAVKKGLLKPNTASRRKSAIAKLAKSANVKPAKAVKKAVATKPTTTKKPATKKPASTSKPKPAPKTASTKAKAPAPKTSGKRPSAPKAK